jgi:hypothetical protein
MYALTSPLALYSSLLSVYTVRLHPLGQKIYTNPYRMEGKVRRHCCTRLLLDRTQLLALYLCLCYRRVSNMEATSTYEHSS